MVRHDRRVTAIRQTSTRLADGRELIYFDDAGTPERERRADERALDARPATPTMRFDALSAEWVTVATARQGRVHLPPAEFDPLAPQSPGNPSEVPDDYDVAVFENRSPSFGPGTADACPDSFRIASARRWHRRAAGAARSPAGFRREARSPRGHPHRQSRAARSRWRRRRPTDVHSRLM